MALESTQPLTKMSTRCISWGKGGRCVRLTTLLPSCAVVMKSENLNFLEPSEPLQACNGTALPFFTLFVLCIYVQFVCFLRNSPQWAMASSFTRLLDHTQSDTSQSVGLLWTSDQPVAETSTWQHTTFTYSITPLIRINWDGEPSVYAWKPYNWTFLWK